MTWLFFIDESGHDHKTTPYEVRGGIALHVEHLWPFVQDVQRLELDCFGCRLSDFGKEIKGSTLTDRKRYKLAGQKENFQDEDRRRLYRSFLEKGRRHDRPNQDEFTAYGQACIRMAQKLFDLLRTHEAVLFASAIPRGAVKPPNYEFDDYLRKDVVFFLERFFYFLERKREHVRKCDCRTSIPWTRIQGRSRIRHLWHRLRSRSLRGKGKDIKKEATPRLPYPRLTRGAGGAEPPSANLDHRGQIVNPWESATSPQPGTDRISHNSQ